MKKQWVFNQKNRKPKAKISQQTKDTIQTVCDIFIDAVLKKRIKPPRKNSTENYCVDIFSTWRSDSLSIMAIYHCPHPRAISPTFQVGLARLIPDEHTIFTLQYMRHTGKWQTLFGNMSLDECLKTIKELPVFEF